MRSDNGANMPRAMNNKSDNHSFAEDRSSVNGPLTLYLWSNPLTFNRQQIVGLLMFNGVKTFVNDVHVPYENCHSLPYFWQT
jgi:hypothetical protein